MKRCPYCGSLWVCFNWIRDKNNQSNGQFFYYHECWDCSDVFHTKFKVRNGIPYWALKMFYKEKSND